MLIKYKMHDILEKWWLLGQLQNLDIDVIYLIKQHTRVIKPPTYEALKLGIVDSTYKVNDIVYISQFPTYDYFYQTPYNYVETEIYTGPPFTEDEIPEIHFSYFVDNTLYDCTFILNYNLSFINPLHIQIYSIDKDADFIYYKDVLADDCVKEQLDVNIPDISRSGSYVVKGQIVFIA